MCQKTAAPTANTAAPAALCTGKHSRSWTTVAVVVAIAVRVFLVRNYWEWPVIDESAEDIAEFKRLLGRCRARKVYESADTDKSGVPTPRSNR